MIRSGEVSRMHGEQVSSMADWFTVGVLTETAAADGGIASSYVDGDPQKGSVFSPAAAQSYRNQLNIEKCDALLRTDASVHQGDRISIFSRNDAFANEIYYVSAEPIVFRTAVIVPLVRVMP